MSMINLIDVPTALPVAAYATDGEGFISSYNAQAAQLWGREHAPRSQKWFGAWRMRDAGGRILAPDETPLAVAFREGWEISQADVILERPNGHRAWVRVHARLKLEAGKVVSSLALLIERSPTIEDEFQREHLASIVASSQDVIVGKTMDGVITSWNGGATRTLGYDSEEMIGQPITRIIPTELLAEEAEILARIRRGERVEHFETERLAKDGRKVPLSVTVSPLRDRVGNIIGASKVARDITERKQAFDLQRRLIDELDHRVKNTLATVMSFAGLTKRRTVADTDRFSESFLGRIRALVRSHDLLLQGNLRGADLACVISEEVNDGALRSGNAILSGPNIHIDTRTAGKLALVLHELASNARRYGALSAPDGVLRIDWSVAEDTAELVLCWSESGGQAVSAPADSGYGISLIKSVVASLEGNTSFDFGPDGLRCTITLPRPKDEWSDSP